MLPSSIKIDKKIKRTYEGLKEIGRGGFGCVYKGVNKLMKEEHAIKIQDINTSKDREIEMLVKFKHKTILPIFYAYKTRTQIISIHPMYENNLKEILENKISIYIKIKLFQGVLNGIHYLHRHNVIHLDLKPANILVNNNYECVVADFGLTKILDNNVVTVSTRIATPGYASPERGDITMRSDYSDDVWALACILFEIFENGTKVNATYISQNDHTCGGSLPFYAHILLPGFKSRGKRITLGDMMNNYKRIALDMLIHTPDMDEKKETIEWLKVQPPFNVEDQPSTKKELLPLIKEEDSEDSQNEPCQLCGCTRPRIEPCTKCQDLFCANCSKTHILEEHSETSEKQEINQIEISITEEVEGKTINKKEMKNINIENSEQFSTQTDSINQNAPLASMQSMSKKSRRIIISILAIVSFIVIGSLVWHIFSLNSDKSKLQKKNEGLKKGKNILEINYNEKLKEYANLKITNSKLSAQYVGLNVSYFKLQEENFREQNELMELKRKHKELQSNITELQLNFDKEQRKLMEFQKFKDEFKLISKDNVKNMKNYLKDEKCVSLENIYSANMYFSIFVLLIYISYRIKIQKGILSQKTERSLIRAPLNSFNFNLKCINSRLPIEFYMIKQCEGIDLWKYDENLKIYNPIQMIQHTESGDHSRGEMNERGIYIGAGNDSIDVKIYDMKYYNHENYKIKLFRKFTYSKRATACIFLNTYQAICCFFDGYLRSYDLTNMNSITETIFTQTNSLRVLRSLLYTEDKQNIIAGGNGTIYIVDIEGILKYMMFCRGIIPMFTKILQSLVYIQYFKQQKQDQRFQLQLKQAVLPFIIYQIQIIQYHLNYYLIMQYFL